MAAPLPLPAQARRNTRRRNALVASTAALAVAAIASASGIGGRLSDAGDIADLAWVISSGNCRSRGRGGIRSHGVRKAPCSIDLHLPLMTARASGTNQQMDMSLDGDIEDDWAVGGGSQVEESDELDEVLSQEQLRQMYIAQQNEANCEQERINAGASVEEASLIQELFEKYYDKAGEEGASAEDLREQMKQLMAERMPDRKPVANSMAGEFKEFSGVGNGISDLLTHVRLNDTMGMSIAQAANSAQRQIDMQNVDDIDESEGFDDRMTESLGSGDSVFPASIIMSRWLAIHPPLVKLQNKTVVELGSGCGLVGIAAARMGASDVLMVDADRATCELTMQSAVKNDIAPKVTTLAANWSSVPERLHAGSESALRPFVDADFIFGSEILYTEARALQVADVLGKLLRSSEQVAHIVDPQPRAYRNFFIERCISHGLTVKEAEIVTWEPPYDDHMEIDADWATVLLTVRRK